MHSWDILQSHGAAKPRLAHTGSERERRRERERERERERASGRKGGGMVRVGYDCVTRCASGVSLCVFT